MSNFLNISNKKYKYTHTKGKTSFDTETKECSCTYMFDYAICAHLIRISLKDAIATQTQLISKKREKLQKLPDQQKASDDDFEANLNLIEMQSGTQISESVPPNDTRRRKRLY